MAKLKGFAYLKAHGRLEEIKAAGKLGGQRSKRGKAKKAIDVDHKV